MVVGPSGLPMPRSGNFADVYQLRTPAGREWAVKCFTRPVTGLDERYRKVSDALGRANLPFAVGFTYLAEGVCVQGRWMPALKMEWVDGIQLNQFVRENAGRPALLDALAHPWVRVCRRLREAGIAHADVQHGNVLMVNGSKPGALAVKLIDYDGMFVEESPKAGTEKTKPPKTDPPEPAESPRPVSPETGANGTNAPSPAATGRPTILKPLWAAPTFHDSKRYAAFTPDPESGLVLVFGGIKTTGGANALDIRTGKPRPGFAGLSGQVAFRQDPPRIGTYNPGDAEYQLWDAKTGQQLGKRPVPDIGPAVAKTHKTAFLSPNGRFLAVGLVADQYAPPIDSAPVEIHDTTTGKKILALTWTTGTVLFTGDSSRALVAERGGRARWFKLPSGEADGEWEVKFPRPGSVHHFSNMSDDGVVVGCTGPGDAIGRPFPQLLDGKTGAVLKRFGREYCSFDVGPVVVSADGRRAALLRHSQADPVMTVEVFDVPTGTAAAWARMAVGNTTFPQFQLSPDGRTLLVHDDYERRLMLYELPAQAGGTVAAKDPTADPVVPKGTRAAVPADAVVTKAEADVRGILKADYARKLPPDRKALAQKLVTLAEQTADDPAARFVMLRDARDFATELGDAVIAAQSIDGLAKWFEIDAAKQKGDAFDTILAAQTGVTTLRSVADIASAAADTSFEEDDYENAVRLAQIAAAAARKAGVTGASLDDADFRLAQLKKTRDAFAGVKPSLELLKTAPDDPEANFAAGKFRCFTQGRWAEGVKLLAKGSHPLLKEAAGLEASAPPTGPADVRIADLWWDYAQQTSDAEKWAADKRARYWYGRAAPGLMGLAKARAEGRTGFTANGVDYRPGLVVDFTAKPASVLKGVKARVEAGIDFTAGEFQDGAKAGEVTARWTGIIVPPRPGRYRLVAATTDPVRVRIEGKLVIDTVAARAGKREAMVTLLDRPAAIVVDFSVPNTAVHRLKLTWVPVGGSDSEAIPPECLYHDRKAETGIGK